MNIRLATDDDWSAIWPVFRDIARLGETYAYPRDIEQEQAKQLWLVMPRQTYVVECEGEIVASYYIKTNQAGPGSHVCNCGYMVSESARGKGLATLMCQHSQDIALELGYQAMQFNFVASSNTGAVKLWQKLGFSTVGQLPKAFNHPNLGYVDALVMYKWLQ